MTIYKLTEKADPDVIYDIELVRYGIAFCEQHGVTRAVFRRWCERQQSIGYEADGQPIGGMLFDHQPHIAVLPEHHGKWAVLFKASLEWLFAIQDPVRTQVEADNKPCIRFMERNGWRRVDADERFITYEVTAQHHPLFDRTAAAQRRAASAVQNSQADRFSRGTIAA
jgi:GNAT superfamily N-acetyltransferase